MKYQGIYKIRNLKNGKVYIGQSYDLTTRFRDHRKPCKFKSNRPLYSSIKKYGIENFEFIVLEWIEDISKLDEREQYWMDYYKSYNLEYGYNLSPTSGGSTRGIKHTEEHKQKIGLAGKGRKHTEISIAKMVEAQKGKPKSEEHRLKLVEVAKKRWENPDYRKHMSETQKGKSPWNKGIPCSKEHKEAISKANKDKKKEPFTEEHKRKIGLGNKGKIVSDETRQKIAESRKGTKQSDETRKKKSESMKLKWKDPEYKKNKKKEQESKILLLPKGDIVDINLLSKEAVNE